MSSLLTISSRALALALAPSFLLLLTGPSNLLPPDHARVIFSASIARIGGNQRALATLVSQALLHYPDAVHAPPDFDIWPWVPPLLHASAGGNVELTEVLLQAGADPLRGSRRHLDPSSQDKDGDRVGRGGEGETPFYVACQGGHEEVVRRLGDVQAVREQEGRATNTGLMVASEGGHVRVVRYLLACLYAPHLPSSRSRLPPLDIDAQDARGASALHLACRRDRAEVVSLLLAAGASLEARVGGRAGRREGGRKGVREGGSDGVAGEMWGASPPARRLHVKRLAHTFHFMPCSHRQERGGKGCFTVPFIKCVSLSRKGAGRCVILFSR